MAAGFEARARITADVSSFVSGTRAAANAARQLGAAVRQLRASLSQTQQAARAAASAMAPLASAQQAAARAQQVGANAARSSAQANNQQAQSARQAASAANQQAAAARTNAAAARQQTQAARTQAAAARTQATAARQLSQAMQASAQATRQQGTAARTTQGAMHGLTSSIHGQIGVLWAMHSALSEIEQALNSTARVAQAAFSAVFNAFSGQEMVIAHLSRVTQETEKNVGRLAEGVRQLAAEIPIAFDELGQIAIFGAQVGVANQHLLEFTETVALFAATTPVAAEEAALMFARIQQMTEIDDTQMRNLGAAVSELGSNSAALEGEILKTIESIAVVATQSEFAETSIIGLGAAMASLRIRPELARGAMQRVMFRLGEAAQGASERTQKLADVMGITQEEVANLQATDPDKFFFDLMESLHGVSQSGEDLVPVLRELGIINTRDIDVISRLAQNYDLLESSVAMANRSFTEATFLQKEASRIFDTVTARVQILQNVLGTFGAKALEAFAPFISGVLDAATATVQFMDALGFVAPLVGFIAMLLGVVGVLAAVAAVIVSLRTGFVALQSVWLTARAAGISFTAAMVGNTAATAANAVATTALGGALVRLRAAALAAGTAMKAAWAASPLVVVGAIVAAVVGVATAFDVLFNSTERANRKLMESNAQFHQAAGGLEQLNQAIMQDTASMREMEEAAGSSGQATALRTVEVRDAADADTALGISAQEAANELRVLEDQSGKSADQIIRSAEAAGNADPELQAMAMRVEELQQATEGATDSVDGMNLAIGLETLAWAEASAQASILEHDILGTGAAFDEFYSAIESGGGLTTLVAAELVEAGTGAQFLRDSAEEVRSEMGLWEEALNIAGEGLSDITFGLLDFSSDSETAARALEDLANNFDSNTLAISQAEDAYDLFDKTLLLSDGTLTTIEELEELGVQGFKMAQDVFPAAEDAASSFGLTVEQLSEALASFIDPVQAWSDAMEGTTGTSEAAGQALLDMQANASQHFGSFISGMEDMQQAQMAWSQNLLELAGDGRITDEVLLGLAEMGSEGAGIVAGLVDATDAEVDRFVSLWESGGGIMLEDFSATFSTFLRMARDAGDSAGTDFAFNLLEKVRAGEITFGEAVTQMVDFAEEEFEGADPTMDAQLEVAEALRELNNLLAQVIEQFAEMNGIAIVRPEVDNNPFDLSLKALAEHNRSEFDQMDEESTTEPEVKDSLFREILEALRSGNSETFDEMDKDSETEPRSLVELFRDTLERLQNTNESSFLTMDQQSFTQPEMRNNPFNSSLSGLQSRLLGAFQNMRSNSIVSPRLSPGTFISGLNSLVSQALSYAARLRSILTVSASISGAKGARPGVRAQGGWVTGPGGPTQDKVPMLLSPGEFVVRESAAQEFGPLLEAINRSRGVGTAPVMTPNFVPDDIMTMPRRPVGDTAAPAELLKALNGVPDGGGGPRVAITVNNQYPQAEPTSVTVNRALAFAGALDGVS